MAEADRPVPHLSPSGSRVIEFGELINALIRRKWLIIAITLAAATVGAVVSIALPNYYRSEALLALNEREGRDAIGGFADQYGGLAGLAGLSLGDGGNERINFGLEVLQSRAFLTSFIERRDLLVPILAVSRWDESNQTVVVDNDIYDADKKQWVRKARPPRGVVPSLQEAYEEFIEENFSVSKDSGTGFVRLSVEHVSPIIAKQIIDHLVQDLNETVRARDIEEAEKSIDYLNDQVSKTTVADLREVFYRLIEQQTQTVMLARVSDEYLFKTIDPAFVPEIKSGPLRSVIVVMSAVTGALLVCLIIVFRLFAASGKES